MEVRNEKDRKNIFWAKEQPDFVGEDIILPPDNVRLSPYGKITEAAIIAIPKYYPNIELLQYVVMPNHIHLLLQINTDIEGRPMAAPTISTVMNQTKGVVSKIAGFSVWQKGFYDHVIRSEQDYLDIWNYIEGNPSKWTEDKLYISDCR